MLRLLSILVAVTFLWNVTVKSSTVIEVLNLWKKSILLFIYKENKENDTFLAEIVHNKLAHVLYLSWQGCRS